jgi:hypothetical protein
VESDGGGGLAMSANSFVGWELWVCGWADAGRYSAGRCVSKGGGVTLEMPGSYISSRPEGVEKV